MSDRSRSFIDHEDLDSPTHTNYGSKTPSGNPRIYNCKQCNRAFTREEHLTRHTLSTHNKLKPFTCGICQRPFSRRDLLLRHAKNLHQGSELAVSRIRKSYRRNESLDSQGLEEDELDSVSPEMYSNPHSHSSHQGHPGHHSSNMSSSSSVSSVSSSASSPTTRRSIDNSDLMTSTPVGVAQNIPIHPSLTSANSSNSSTSTLLHDSSSSSSLMHDPNTSPSYGKTTNAPPSYDTPEKKRMKMSVNMLVS